MKIIKIIRVFLCVGLLIIIGKISWYLIYSATSVTCLESKPEDSFWFGTALAINDNYIAVGDPKANRVAIYSYDEAEKEWSRTREIYPPKNSIIDRVGSGFGYSLTFNQNQLIIGSLSHLVKDKERKYRYHGAVYSLILDEDHPNTLREIKLPESIELSGYSLAIFNNKIAIGATIRSYPGEKLGKVLIVNPNTLKVETIIEPPILPSRGEDFGSSIAGDSKSLIIGSPSIPTLGGVYFANEQGEIVDTISIAEISSADEKRRFGSPVALGDGFIATGTSKYQTSIFKKLSQGWSEIYAVYFSGSFSTLDSQLLVSAGRYPFDRGRAKRESNHLLIDVQNKKAVVKSKIFWQWGFYYYEPEAKGAINSKYLLLSRRGKVVLLKKNYLPRNYVINRSFCKDK